MQRCEVCGRKPKDCQCRLVTCANCGRQFKVSDYEALFRAIVKREPFCSTECGKVLGYVR